MRWLASHADQRCTGGGLLFTSGHQRPGGPSDGARARRGSVALALLLFVGLVFGAPARVFADIGIMLLEPIGTIGFLTRAGHSAIYLSNICPDGSPVKLRLCRPGERGGVISKYTPISPNEDYDWAIVPVEPFLNGLESPELAPLIGSPKLQRAIQVHDFGPIFSSAVTGSDNGQYPDGEWQATLATRFDRTIYNLIITTTLDQDRTIVEAFNAAPNKSRFNFFYRNCTNQTKMVLNLVLAEDESIGDRVGGLTMEVPKGLAKTIVARALEHPDLQLRVERYTQLPGMVRRSREPLFPMENTYKNISFAPYWYFVGYSVFGLGAAFYHEVISPFSLIGAMKDFVSARAADLTVEQQRLEGLDARIRTQLRLIQPDGSEARVDLERQRALVRRRLLNVNQDKDAEVRRILGSKAQWRELESQFRSTVKDVGQSTAWPDDIRRCLLQRRAQGEIARQVLSYFEAHGDFYIDTSHQSPWLRLRLSGQEWQATGLSESQVLAGSPELGFLILATVIDYNLSRPEGRREPIEHMTKIYGLLREAATMSIAER
jgi:hypothetical protein